MNQPEAGQIENEVEVLASSCPDIHQSDRFNISYEAGYISLDISQFSPYDGVDGQVSLNINAAQARKAAAALLAYAERAEMFHVEQDRKVEENRKARQEQQARAEANRAACASDRERHARNMGLLRNKYPNLV